MNILKQYFTASFYMEVYMYNNYPRNYINNYNQQTMYEQIDNQINQLQQMREQIKQNNQQPAINQTFQLAPTNNHTVRYADTIDDVSRETVYYDTPFFSKDMSVLWFKNAKGEIKSYELNEIIPKDDKDIQIEFLQSQIEELKGMINDDRNGTNVITKQDTTDTPEYDEPDGDEPKKNKSTGIQKISGSKKK